MENKKSWIIGDINVIRETDIKSIHVKFQTGSEGGFTHVAMANLFDESSVYLVGEHSYDELSEKLNKILNQN